MKIYTKTGDLGETSLYDGSRAPKYAINFEVLGEIDELSCRIGMLISLLNNDDRFNILFLRKIQRTLQNFNSHIATIDQTNRKLPVLSESLVQKLEEEIDNMEFYNPTLTKFILPGVTQEDSQAHLCRTQARKVERVLNNLHNTSELLTVYKKGEHSHVELEQFKIPEIMLSYMNRLSDYFFVLARYICVTRDYDDYFLD